MLVQVMRIMMIQEAITIIIVISICLNLNQELTHLLQLVSIHIRMVLMMPEFMLKMMLH